MDETEARTAKLLAETAEIEARTARAAKSEVLLQERNELRRRSLEAAVTKAECEARIAQITLVDAERDEALRSTDWRHAKTLNFIGSVDKTTAQAAIDRLHQFMVIEPGCEITIVFNSPGGSVIDGMALFDFIRFARSAGHKVTIIALGYAASMAGILLQAADVRVMAKGSWMLIHEVAFGASGKIGEVEDMAEFGKRLKEQAAQIFVERSGGKLTREYLEQKWQRRDWWINPNEALELGLIDEIR